MNDLFNKELLLRIFSLIFFIPLVIFPILYSNYLTVFIYLIFNSLIVFEFNKMKTNVEKYFIINIFVILTCLSFLFFIMLVISSYDEDFKILEIILIIWFFDTFSFLGGKLFGGKKLMPKISAGKTVSGLLVGFFSTLLIFQLFVYYFNFFSSSLFFYLIIILLAFIGDLLASLLKRYVAIKDSGNIMPGHGGLLDRFDSFIFVFFIYGLLVLI
tara:strand:- start:156 stop:797 length:642 start_codon:yes stop_codon:yes gene_type:complete